MSISEAQLQRMVTDLARWCGYLYFHDNDPRRNRRGFLDLMLVHPRTGRLIFIELKSDKGRLRPEQQAYMEALGIQHEVYLWRPHHWTDGVIRRVLTEERARVAA